MGRVARDVVRCDVGEGVPVVLGLSAVWLTELWTEGEEDGWPGQGGACPVEGTMTGQAVRVWRGRRGASQGR